MLAHHLIFFSSSCLLSFVCKQMQTREKKMMMREASLKSLTAWRLTHILAAYLFLFIVAAIKIRVSQAVTKDLSSSSKFSGSCVLTLQTLQIKEKERRSVCVNTCQDPLRTSFLSSLWSLRCHLSIACLFFFMQLIGDDIMIKEKLKGKIWWRDKRSAILDPETFPIPLFEREENVLMASFSFLPSTIHILFFLFQKGIDGKVFILWI